MTTVSGAAGDYDEKVVSPVSESVRWDVLVVDE